MPRKPRGQRVYVKSDESALIFSKSNLKIVFATVSEDELISANVFMAGMLAWLAKADGAKDVRDYVKAEFQKIIDKAPSN